jgi:membrane protein DedA with SNARE-associated domain
MITDPHDVRRRRLRLAALLAPVAVLSAAGTLADWFAAPIITTHPLLQVFLNPRIRYLVLASTKIAAAPFFVVGFLRLVLTDPIFYLLGRWHGDAALRWMERSGALTPRSIHRMERWFGRAAYPIVAVSPNGFICLLAGTSGMSPLIFTSLNVLGTLARLIVIRAFAEVLERPLGALLEFVSRYQWWIVGISVVLGGLQVWRRRRAGRAGIPADASGT